MKITRDPRCPAHPNHEVVIGYAPPGYNVGVWHCDACGRPLGVATIHPDHIPPTFPHGRRPSAFAMAYNAMDFDWVYRFAEPEEVHACDPDETRAEAPDERDDVYDYLDATESE